MSDTDEWDDTPIPIQRRPSGQHVVSARIPAALALGANHRADQTGLRLSDIVRDALAAYLRPGFSFEVTHSDRVRVVGFSVGDHVVSSLARTFNSNTVVTETMHLAAP